MNGDGVPDIVTGAGPGGGPHVRAFDGVTGSPLAALPGGFLAYPPGFAGGVLAPQTAALSPPLSPLESGSSSPPGAG